MHTVQVSDRIVSVLGDLAQIEWPHLANWSNKPEWKIIQEEIKQKQIWKWEQSHFNDMKSEAMVNLNIQMIGVLIILNAWIIYSYLYLHI